MSNVYHGPRATSEDLQERLLRAEQLNAELARMLKANEWHGGGSDNECPHCGGYKRHEEDCALAALLKKARNE